MKDADARRAIDQILRSCEELEEQLTGEIAALKKENGVLKRKADQAESVARQALSLAKQLKAALTRNGLS